MPLPPVWNLEVCNNRLYVKAVSELQISRGPILDVQSSKEKPNYVKVFP